MIAEATLEKIKSRLSIVDVVSDYVSLKKSGRNYSGLCPFHQEKTPSFHVNPDKQIFHCFGCHKGGNLFTFISLIEGLHFVDTVKKLADRAQVSVDEIKTPFKTSTPSAALASEPVLKALKWAAQYFHFLLKESKQQEAARRYVKERNLNADIVDKFMIGVSPSGWSTLKETMLKKGFKESALIQAGLIVERSSGTKGTYDRFRDRLMFPIRNPEGEVIGFGGRAFSEEQQPKYLNSSESVLFQKRQNLYGLYENSRGIRLKGEAVLVEGYMDVCGLAQHGVDNAVATMGTAFTIEHCQLIKKYSPQIVAVFDPDPSGQEAARRSMPIFLSQGILAKELTLPDMLDPDEYVNKFGKEEFYNLCEKAQNQVNKRLKDIASLGPLSEEQRASFMEELLPILVASRKSVKKMIWWDNISLILQISLQALEKLVEDHLSSRNPATAVPSSSPKPDSKKASPIMSFDPLEFTFFKCSIENPRLLTEETLLFLSKVKFNPVLLTYLQEGFEAYRSHHYSSWTEDKIQSESDFFIQAALSAVALRSSDKAQATEEQSVYQDLLTRLKTRDLEKKIKIMKAQLKIASQSGDEDETLHLLKKLKDLRAEIAASSD